MRKHVMWLGDCVGLPKLREWRTVDISEIPTMMAYSMMAVSLLQLKECGIAGLGLCFDTLRNPFGRMKSISISSQDCWWQQLGNKLKIFECVTELHDRRAVNNR